MFKGMWFTDDPAPSRSMACFAAEYTSDNLCEYVNVGNGVSL